MLVQTLRPELVVEAFDKGVVRWLAGPGEVERNSFHICPQIQIARDKLTSLIHPDRGRRADLGTDPFQHVDHIGRAEAEPGSYGRRVSAERVHDREDTLLWPRRQLAMDEVHGPYIIDPGGRTAAFPQLRLHPSLGCFLAQLQAHLPVKPVNPLSVDCPVLTLK